MNQQNIKKEIRFLEKEIDSCLKPYYEYENEFLKNFNKNSLLDKFVDWYNKDLSRQIRLRYKYSAEFGLKISYELSLDLLQQNLNETQRVKLVREELLDKLDNLYNQFLIEYRDKLQNELKEWR